MTECNTSFVRWAPWKSIIGTSMLVKWSVLRVDECIIVENVSFSSLLKSFHSKWSSHRAEMEKLSRKQNGSRRVEISKWDS